MIRLGLFALFLVFCTAGMAQDQDSEVVFEDVAIEISGFYGEKYSASMRSTPVAFILEDYDGRSGNDIVEHTKLWMYHYLIEQSSLRGVRTYQLVEREKVEEIWKVQKRSCDADVSLSCAIALGENLAASSLVFAKIKPDGKKNNYLLHVRIANAENGGLERSFVRKFVYKGPKASVEKEETNKGGERPSAQGPSSGAAANTELISRMGPRLGIGLATQSVGGLFQNTSNLMPAPVIGWHFDFPVHRQVSISPELLWMTKGFSARNPAQAVRTRSTFRYLELPVLIKVKMEKNQSDGLFLLVGPSMGYFLSGRYKQWTDGELQYDGKYTLPPNGQRLQFSGLVGMGIDGDRWGFDVRAQTSLTPFERFTRIQNVVYAITLAYRFPV